MGKLFAPLAMKISGGIIAGLLIALGIMWLLLQAEQDRADKWQKRSGEWQAAHGQLERDTRDKTALAQAQDAANKARVEKEQITVTQEKVSAYQKDLAALRARYDALRLRTGTAPTDQGGGGNKAVPGVPGSPGGTDGAAGQDGLPDSDALIASEQALRLKALQEWVRAQWGVER